MATGFAQRWKGKVTADALWVSGWFFNGVQSPAAASTLNTFMNANIISATAASAYTLQPPEPGVPVTLALTNVSSGVAIKAAAGSNFGVMGGSSMIVMKSTVQMTIEMVGVSTVSWAIKSVWSTSTSVIPQPTFSTTT